MKVLRGYSLEKWVYLIVWVEVAAWVVSWWFPGVAGELYPDMGVDVGTRVSTMGGCVLAHSGMETMAATKTQQLNEAEHTRFNACTIKVFLEDEGHWQDVLLDTGAALTMFPESALKRTLAKFTPKSWGINMIDA